MHSISELAGACKGKLCYRWYGVSTKLQTRMDEVSASSLTE
jgi:hypothetical protein